jgi:hypothetical protein
MWMIQFWVLQMKHCFDVELDLAQNVWARSLAVCTCPCDSWLLWNWAPNWMLVLVLLTRMGWMWSRIEGTQKPSRPSGEWTPLYLSIQIVESSYRLGSRHWEAPFDLVCLSSVCMLSLGQPARAIVAGLFALINHSAADFTAYVGKSHWDHFSFKVSCAHGRHLRVYITCSLSQLSSALCLANMV